MPIVLIYRSKFEAIPDDLTPEEILEQAQKAAKNASERLSAKKPNSKVNKMITYLCNQQVKENTIRILFVVRHFNDQVIIFSCLLWKIVFS